MLVSPVQVSSSQHEDGYSSDGASAGIAAGPHDHRLAPDQDAAELRDGGGAAVRLPLHLQGDPVLRVHQVTILETALCTDKIMIMLYLYLCRTDSYNSAAWCATAVDPGGNVVTNRCVIISSHIPTTIHVSCPGGVTVTPPGARWRLPGAARRWGARAWASPASSPSPWTGRPITSARCSS